MALVSKLDSYLLLGMQGYGLAAINLNQCQSDFSFAQVYGFEVSQFRILELLTEEMDIVHIVTDNVGIRDFSFEEINQGGFNALNFTYVKGLTLVNV